MSPSTSREFPPRVNDSVVLRDAIERIVHGEDLSAAESESVFEAFMDGSAAPSQMAGILVALRCKGVAPEEVAGGVRALRGAMIPVAAEEPDGLVDTAGTGGGSVTTFNISTAAALVAAGAQVRMAKHGNRSFTSRSGSADVLEALGVGIELEPGEMSRVLREVGIVFMFAPLLHPAMRHVGPVRRELGITTVMNILGPLTNPAGARRQVVGVADPTLLPLIVAAFRELGHLRAFVAHGLPGMDEISPSGPTHIAELIDGQVRESTLHPEDVGLDRVPVDGLSGGTPGDNARLILRVLEGNDTGAALSATLLNAGAAIYVSGRVGSLSDGVRAAEESIGSGAAIRKLEELRSATQR